MSMPYFRVQHDVLTYIFAITSFYRKIGGKKCGSLPLHIASRNGCDAEILKMLFEAYPPALEMKNMAGDTPLQSGAGHVSQFWNFMLWLFALFSDDFLIKYFFHHFHCCTRVQARRA